MAQSFAKKIGCAVVKNVIIVLDKLMRILKIVSGRVLMSVYYATQVLLAAIAMMT